MVATGNDSRVHSTGRQEKNDLTCMAVTFETGQDDGAP